MYNESENHSGQNSSDSFALASLILGSIGIALGCCAYPSIICGALAILFALLSRGSSLRLSQRAKIGLWLGITSAVLGVLMIVLSILTILLQYGSFSNYMDQVMEMYEQLLSSYGAGSTLP